jgi:internalin A
LREALQEAADYLREQHGTAVIGTGRATVKRRIEGLRDADAKRPREERQHRTISQDVFLQFCDEAVQAGDVISDPAQLLTYLNNVGTVFYRKKLFNDRIILDQGWAL